MDNNALDLELAESAGVYFRLSDKEMDKITEEVKSYVSNWQKIASEIGIPRNEQAVMRGAFRI